MVTNLPAKAKAKWADVVASRSIPDKIRLMKEFVALCPKHKGTNKLLANVRQRIIALERELERAKSRRKGSRKSPFSVAKEGAGQLVILGQANVGKSSLLTSTTNAKPVVSPIPHTTRTPALGMLQYQDVQFQLVEAPALVEGAAEGRMQGHRILSLARNADGLLLMVDLNKDSVKQLGMLTHELKKGGITIDKPAGEVDIIRQSAGIGVKVVGSGSLTDCTVEDVKRLLRNYHITSALINIRGQVRLGDIEDALFSSTTWKSTVIVANKTDVVGAQANLQRLIEAFGIHPPILEVSCKDGTGLDKIGESIFQMLRIVRVYSKEPYNKQISKKPVIVEEGTRAIEVARELHSELHKGFRYAKIWGPSAKYPGERVGSEHIMVDGDILEIH